MNKPSIYQNSNFPLQLISSRMIPFLDSHSLAAGHVREALFRSEGDRYILYLTDGNQSSDGEERIILLGTREALIWLNESSQDHGSFWT